MISWQALTELSAVALRSELAQRENATIKVEGHSMRPFIRPGAIVRLRRPRSADPHVGDIVAADLGDRVVLHRVIQVGETVRTQGDRVARADPAIERDEILGIADGIQSRAGIWLPVPSGAWLGAALRGLSRLWSRGH